MLIVVSAVALMLQAGAADVMAQIQRSHIEANVPVEGEFMRILQRDMDAYFQSKRAQTQVAVELLREGPTQAGVASPKFYAWVRVTEGGSLVKEGAVRLAAIERERFEVAEYVSANDIRARPEDLYGIFPRPVCERIKDKLGIPPGTPQQGRRDH